MVRRRGSRFRLAALTTVLGLFMSGAIDAQFQNLPGALQQISVGADGTVWGLNSAGEIYKYDSQQQTWVQERGALAQIAVGSASSVWGLNAAGQIYRWNTATQVWDLIPGNLSQIAVGADGDVWGLNYQEHIYHFNAQTQGWTQIPGTLKQIAVGFDGAVWAINSANSVYRFNPGTGFFRQVPGTMTYIAAGADGDVWGLNDTSVYHFDRLSQSWDHMPGTLSQISVGAGSNVWGLGSGGQVYQYDALSTAWAPMGVTPLTSISAGANGAVWGLGSPHAIYRFTGPTQPAQVFHQLPATAAITAVGADGSIWTLNSAGQIYTYNPLTGGWTNVPGQLSRIAVGTGESVWGINSANQIYRYDPATRGWDSIPGSLAQIAVGANGDVWGLNIAGQIYRFNAATQGWTNVPGSLRQIAVGADGSVWGINNANQIYEFNPANGNWKGIPGSLTQIAVGSSANVWGINPAGAVYHFDVASRSWAFVPGVSLTQIAAGFDGAVWGVNSANQVFDYSAHTAAWTLVAGSLSQVSVGSDAAVLALDSSGSAYYLVQAPVVPQGLAVISVSNSSPLPLTPIYIGTSGLNLNTPVSVQFSDQQGFKVAQGPIRVQPDGTVVVAAPIYFDPNVGDSRPATVSLVIAQGAYSTSPVALNIQDLPHLTDYRAQLGAVSHSFLNYAALSAAHRINEVQALNSLPGNTVNASPLLSSLNTLLLSTIEARADIDNVSNDNSLVISAGTLPDGTPLQFDHHSLDMMDRVLAMYLTQLAPNMLSPPPSPNVRAAGSAFGEQPRPMDSGSTLGSVLSYLTTSANISGLAVTAQGYATSDKTWLDKTLAVEGGFAGLLGFATQSTVGDPLLNVPLSMASSAFGAQLGLTSMLNDLGQELGSGAFLLLYSNSDVDPDVLEEAAKNAGSANTHLAIDSAQTFLSLLDFGISSGSFAGTASATFGSEVGSVVDTLLQKDGTAVALQSGYLLVNAANFAASGGFDSQQSIVAQFANKISNVFGSATQGFAQLIGTADVTNSLGTDGALTGAELASDLSDSFSTLADANGNYNLWATLGDPNFDYANADFEIFDPVSQNTINSSMINLSALDATSPFSVPTLMGSCIETDAGDPDSDDPDCDSTAQLRRPAGTRKAVARPGILKGADHSAPGLPLPDKR